MEVDPEHINPCAYVFYYIILFFAYWFGAARFDYDNDGDFDVDDVHKYMQDAHIVKKEFRKKKKRPKSQRTLELQGKDGKQAKTNAKPKAKAKSRPREDAHPISWSDKFHDEVQGDFDDIERELQGTFAADVEGEETVEDEVMHQSFPLFIVGQTILALLSWTVASVYLSSDEGDFGQVLNHKAGLDTFSDGWSDLVLTDGSCEDYRGEVWRYLTYQWTHIGIMHIMLNCFMNLVLGIPLEGLHGHFRLLLMYNGGVLGGAFCYWVGDAHKRVVGMSGGCYALLGMHVGNLLMNWKQMKFRWIMVFFLLFLTTADLSCYFISLGSGDASHSAHLGGSIAGLMLSTVVGTNLVVLRWERILQAVTTVIAFSLSLWCIIHLIFNKAPHNIFEDYGWCYVGQVHDFARFGNVWQCVQCANKECIEQFRNAGPDIELLGVDTRECSNFFFEGKIYNA